MEEAFRHAMRAAPAMVFPTLGRPGVAAAEREWWAVLVRRVVEQNGLTALAGSRFGAFFADLYEHFTTADAWTTFGDARPALERLKKAGLVVGLITNYDTRVYQVLDALGLSTLLDSVTIPAVAGAAKPARAIFDYALRQHGIAAQHAVYVGDEIGDDYDGAQGAGMRAVLIDREGKSKREGISSVGNLEELLSFLDFPI
jgi:putative hydrolase of the HAD superfamily